MKLRELDQGVKMDMMTKTMFNEWRTGIEDRIYDNNESIFACKKALQNHTKHITAIKKEIEMKATKRQIDEIVKQMKRFALNDEYKVLYDKVVPPISVMQESNKDLSKTVA